MDTTKRRTARLALLAAALFLLPGCRQTPGLNGPQSSAPGSSSLPEALRTQEITAQAEEDALFSGMNLLRSSALDLDDGQEWMLLLRKGEQYYPLYERTYLQLGTVDYLAFYSFDTGWYHVLVTRQQSAGLEHYDCVYNPESQSFERIPIYGEENINMMG